MLSLVLREARIKSSNLVRDLKWHFTSSHMEYLPLSSTVVPHVTGPITQEPERETYLSLRQHSAHVHDDALALAEEVPRMGY